MPQIFHPSTHPFSRVRIVGALFFLAGIAGILTLFFRSSYVSRVNVVVAQPVDFSHQAHVSGRGIDCRYCHTSVEESGFAGIPSTQTCMTCHSQIFADSPALAMVRESFQNGESIPWIRVHDLPDFAYFDHQIHVAKGVGCETCHGRVDQMPLIRKTETFYMEFCLECHRNPERYIRPREEVYTMGYVPPQDQQTLGLRLVEEYDIAPGSVLDDCYICHR